jgi:Fe-S-cluster formation regulator IscX/YfhJ
METIKDLRLAVLIDADNIPYGNVREMMEEIAKYGTPTFKRIYADWTRPTLAGWKKVLLENAITPIQQYSYSTGKNSSDSAMIIDAMDILYSGRVDGFCIVSSDSDFTRLAIRLREAGMKVIGIGERKTLTALISACDKFIYLEILRKQPEETPAAITAGKPKKSGNKSRSIQKAPNETTSAKNIPAESVPFENTLEESSIAEDAFSGNTSEERATVESTSAENTNLDGAPVAGATIKTIDNDVIKLIAGSISDVADEAGWAFLGDLGNQLLKKQPDFDPRNYGFKKLVPFIKSLHQFEIDERETGKGRIKHVFVRAPLT